jgi:hypothetical protein
MYRYIVTFHTDSGSQMLALNADNIHKVIEYVRQDFPEAHSFMVKMKVLI